MSLKQKPQRLTVPGGPEVIWRGHGHPSQKGFSTAHGKPAVVNVNMMSSIIPSGMLSGHTLSGCFDEIMI